MEEDSEPKRDYPLLRKAPPHDSEEFVTFLEENNPVVKKTDHWILIENCKYHTVTHPHYTLFPIRYAASWSDLSTDELADLKYILDEYGTWYKYENEKSQKTIDRFHYHLVRDYNNWVINTAKQLKIYALQKEKVYKGTGLDLYEIITAIPRFNGEDSY